MSTQWKHTFKDRLATPEEATRSIERGRSIFIGSGAAEPNVLVEALVTHGQHLADNHIVHLLTLGPAPYVRPGLENRFRHTAFFIGSKEGLRVSGVEELVGELYLADISVPPVLYAGPRLGLEIGPLFACDVSRGR